MSHWQWRLTLDQLKSLEHHYARVKDCKTHSVVVQQITHLGKCFIRHKIRCGSRFCPTCSQRKQRSWEDKITKAFISEKCVFITLTFDSRAPDPFQDPSYYSHVWENFLHRLHRRFKDIKFVRFVEITENGKPHLHILINRYIPQKYISWSFEDCGGGKIAHVTYADKGRVSKYVTKYVTKSMSTGIDHASFFFLTRMRSVSTSRNLYFIVPRLPLTSIYSLETNDSALNDLQLLAKRHFAWQNNVLIHDRGSPYFVWIPDPDLIEPDLDPSMTYPLTYRELWRWRFDTRNLPNNGIPIIYQ